PHEVIHAFQPPALGDSFLAMHDTTICQSIDCISTLNPARSIGPSRLARRRVCDAGEAQRALGQPRFGRDAPESRRIMLTLSSSAHDPGCVKTRTSAKCGKYNSLNTGSSCMCAA